MNVFIQGASRGIGLALTRQLLAREQVERVCASARDPHGSDALAALSRESAGRLRLFELDCTDEASIARAAGAVSSVAPRLNLLINVAGVLHGRRARPEKRLEQVELDGLRESFAVNSFGPLLVVKHFLPLLPADERVVVASLSARVGSIGDNRLGGWYGYRASKAAQNMFTRTLSIELRRRLPGAICVGLHPGTVDTDLSRPFQRSVPPDKLFGTDRAAAQLLAVLDGLGPDDSGTVFAWDGSRVPW